MVYWDSTISSAISKNKINKINQTIFVRHLHPTRSKGDVQTWFNGSGNENGMDSIMDNRSW